MMDSTYLMLKRIHAKYNNEPEVPKWAKCFYSNRPYHRTYDSVTGNKIPLFGIPTLEKPLFICVDCLDSDELKEWMYEEYYSKIYMLPQLQDLPGRIREKGWFAYESLEQFQERNK